MRTVEGLDLERDQDVLGTRPLRSLDVYIGLCLWQWPRLGRPLNVYVGFCLW